MGRRKRRGLKINTIHVRKPERKRGIPPKPIDGFEIEELKQGYLAHEHSLVAAKNLKVLLSGGDERKMGSYKAAKPLAIVSLGRKEGVAQILCLTMSGKIPGIIKAKDLFVGKTRKEYGLKADAQD